MILFEFDLIFKETFDEKWIFKVAKEIGIRIYTKTRLNVNIENITYAVKTLLPYGL